MFILFRGEKIVKKKILALFMVVTMLAAQFMTVSAVPELTINYESAINDLVNSQPDYDDIKSVFEAINNDLTPQNKAVLLGGMWDAVVQEINDNSSSADLASVKALVQTALTDAGKWNEIIGSGSGQISEASLDIVLINLLQQRSIILQLHSLTSGIVDKAYVKEKLSLSMDAGDYEVYSAILARTGPIFTEDSAGTFIKNGNVGQTLVSGLVLSELEQVFISESLAGYIDTKVTEAADAINYFLGSNQTAIQKPYIIAVLNSYEMYQAPTPYTPPIGGGVIIPVPGTDGQVGPDELADEVAGTTEELVSGITDGASAEEAVDQGTALINDAAVQLDNVTSADDAITILTSVIENGAALISAAEKQDVSAADLQAAVVNAANKAVAAVGTIASEAVVTAASAKASVVSSADLLAMIADVSKTATAANDSLAKAGIEAVIPAVLTINTAGAKNSIKDAAVELSSDILAAAADSDVAVAVKTDVAAITLPAGAITAEAGKKVTLSAALVGNADLTAEQKKASGNNTVYDFNAFVGDTKISSFNSSVEIAVPYTLKKNENPECVTVFFLNDKGELENVIGVYDAATKTVKFATAHFSKYVVKYNPVEFKDMSKAKWAKVYVDAVAAKGIIKGNGKGSFNPTDNITKGQFVAMIMRTLKLVDKEATTDFKDVAEKYILYPEIASAYELGIISADAKGNFKPDSAITREEMATIIGKVLETVKGKTYKAGDAKYLDSFKDKAQIRAASTKYVVLAAKYGVFIGGDTGNFNPKGAGARASVAAVMYRLLNLE